MVSVMLLGLNLLDLEIFSMVPERSTPIFERQYVLTGQSELTTFNLWFTAIDLDSPKLFMFLKVAIMSAKLNTKLIPVILACGKNDTMESWLRKRNIPVYKDFNNTKALQYLVHHSERWSDLGLSTWLRIAIPDVVNDLKRKRTLGPHNISNINLDYVLYTDADVYFLRNVEINKRGLPRYVGLAIQGDALVEKKNPYSSLAHTNAGVMIVNITSSDEWHHRFQEYIISELELRRSGFQDQTAYHVFFPVRLKMSYPQLVYSYIYYRHYFNSYFSEHYTTVLPKRFEWEPYLGPNNHSVIVHWHYKKLSLPDDCQQFLSPTGFHDAGNDLWKFARLSFEESYNSTLHLKRRKLVKNPNLPNLLGETSVQGYRAELTRFVYFARKVCEEP